MLIAAQYFAIHNHHLAALKLEGFEDFGVLEGNGECRPGEGIRVKESKIN